MSPSAKCFVVVDKDNHKEHEYETIWDARSKLVELVTLGITAYLFTTRMYGEKL